MKKVTELLFVVLVATLLVSAIQYAMVDKTTVVHCNHINREYAFDVIDDSISVYTEDDKFVGTVLIQGQLDSLIIADNE